METKSQSIYEKLLKLREKIFEAGVSPSGVNTFSKYEYITLGDFLPKVMKQCLALRVIGLFNFTSETATLKLINVDAPEDFLEFTSPMSTANLKGCHEVQNLGAVQTYLRRYLWTAALDLVEGDPVDLSSEQDNDAAKAEKEYQDFYKENFKTLHAAAEEGTKALTKAHNTLSKSTNRDLYALMWSAKGKELKEIALQVDNNIPGEENGSRD